MSEAKLQSKDLKEVKETAIKTDNARFWALFEEVQNLRQALIDEKQKNIDFQKTEIAKRNEMLIMIAQTIKTMDLVSYEYSSDKNTAMVEANKLRKFLTQYEFKQPKD